MKRTRLLDLVFAALALAAVAIPRTVLVQWSASGRRWEEAKALGQTPSYDWYPAGQRRLIFQFRQWNNVKEWPDLPRVAIDILTLGLIAAAVAAVLPEQAQRAALELPRKRSQRSR